MAVQQLILAFVLFALAGAVTLLLLVRPWGDERFEMTARDRWSFVAICGGTGAVGTVLHVIVVLIGIGAGWQP